MAVSKHLDNIPKLKSQDIADAVIYVIGTAPHINVNIKNV